MTVTGTVTGTEVSSDKMCGSALPLAMSGGCGFRLELLALCLFEDCHIHSHDVSVNSSFDLVLEFERLHRSCRV